MSKKQTSVEWLYNLSKQRELDKFDLEYAKEMQRNQIIEAWENGLDNFLGTNDSDIMSAEQYYNETFGGAGETSR